MARTAVVIFLTFGALMPAAHSTAGSPARVRNGLIVYTANDSQGRQQIFVVSPDGIGARPLTSSAGQNQYPAWSSDGQRIAFTSSRTGNSELWVMHADGNHQRQLTRPPMNGGLVPSWSPDDKHIAFSEATGPAHAEIWTVDTDGGNLRQLTVTLTPSGSNAASWSPDGRRIAFASDRSGAPEVYTMRPDGTGVRQLTQPTAPLYPAANVPVWSPDGARLAFWSGFEALFGQVWIMGADGSKRRALTSCLPPANCDDPAWSPDGRFILFDRTPLLGLAAGTWVMDADGGRQRLLLPFAYGAGRRPWQPVRNG